MSRLCEVMGDLRSWRKGIICQEMNQLTVLVDNQVVVTTVWPSLLHTVDSWCETSYSIQVSRPNGIFFSIRHNRAKFRMC
jgi:hypothetical protein